MYLATKTVTLSFLNTMYIDQTSMLIRNEIFWGFACKMPEGVKMLATKPHDLNPVPGTHGGGETWTPLSCPLTSTCTMVPVHAHTCLYTHTNNKCTKTLKRNRYFKGE